MPRGRWKSLKPWEQSIERKIHSLKPSCSHNAAVLLGEDPAGFLAAIVVVALGEGPEVTVIEGIAVALEMRGQDGSCADQAMDRALDWAMEKAELAELPRTLVVAKTDPRNTAGRALVERHGFGLAARTSAAETWQMSVIPSAPLWDSDE